MKNAWAAAVVAGLMVVSVAILALLAFPWSDAVPSPGDGTMRGGGDLLRPSYDGDPGIVSDAPRSNVRWM
jgi:hypothetical protein